MWLLNEVQLWSASLAFVWLFLSIGYVNKSKDCKRYLEIWNETVCHPDCHPCKSGKPTKSQVNLFDLHRTKQYLSSALIFLVGRIKLYKDLIFHTLLKISLAITWWDNIYHMRTDMQLKDSHVLLHFKINSGFKWSRCLFKLTNLNSICYPSIFTVFRCGNA